MVKSLLRRWRKLSRPQATNISLSPEAQRLHELRQQLPDATDDQIECIASVESDTMTSPERILALCQGVAHIVQHQIEGSIVECGVWRGGSMAATAKTLTRLNEMDRDLWLYDTFEGMSEPTSNDVDFMGQGAESLLAEQACDEQSSIWCYSPLDHVQQVMTATGYPADRIRFLKGKVENTLPQQTPEQIALLRLDTDWYESTKCELEHLFPKMVNGSILIIDDYGHWEGCRRAVDEYFSQHGISIFLHRIDYTGRMATVCRPNS